MRYLIRRNGHYHLQLRLSVPTSQIMHQKVLRRSLATSDPQIAKRRLVVVMSWVKTMIDNNDEINQRILRIVAEIESFLKDEWPVSQERIWERRQFEILINNFKGKLSYQSKIDINLFSPDFRSLFTKLIEQNVAFEHQLALDKVKQANHEQHVAELEAAKRAAEMEAYLRGRHEEREAAQVYLATLSAASLNNSASFNISGLEMRHQPSRAAALNAPCQSSQGLRLSEAIQAFYQASYHERGDWLDEEECKPVIDYLVHWTSDAYMQDLTPDTLLEFYNALAEVPNRKGMPREHCQSLAQRAAYAEKNGWSKLTRLAVSTIENNYRDKLRRFLTHAKSAGHYQNEIPTFTLRKKVKDNLLAPLPKDKLDDDEIVKILSQPLFTGCRSHTRIWQKGDCFVQNHLYWAYLILLTTGMRTGEVGQLRPADITAIDGRWYFDLRAFDPKKGRVAIKDVKKGKTANAARLLPIPPLLIELGLLARKKELEQLNSYYLFPEWTVVKRNGSDRWSYPVTKSFTYLKSRLKIDRPDLTAYSTRHWFADALDEAQAPSRLRNRTMGHASKDVANRYGGAGTLSDNQYNLVAGIGNKAFDNVAKILLDAKMRADKGELEVVKMHTNKSNWKLYV